MNDFLNNPKLENLTSREKEVLHYLINGQHNEEIAQNLGISFHTAKAHVSSILHKLGVNTRTSAVRIVFDNIINNKQIKDKNSQNKNIMN